MKTQFIKSVINETCKWIVFWAGILVNNSVTQEKKYSSLNKCLCYNNYNFISHLCFVNDFEV